MTKSQKKKTGAGGDRHTHPRKAFHAPAPLLGVLAKYVASVSPATTESAVIRLAIERFLTVQGLWPPAPKS